MVFSALAVIALPGCSDSEEQIIDKVFAIFKENCAKDNDPMMGFARGLMGFIGGELDPNPLKNYLSKNTNDKQKEAITNFQSNDSKQFTLLSPTLLLKDASCLEMEKRIFSPKQRQMLSSLLKIMSENLQNKNVKSKKDS